MISRSDIKFIRSLRIKKFRDINHQFVIEGDKLVAEFLNSSWTVSHLLGKDEWLNGLSENLKTKPERITEVTDQELKKLSLLRTPHNVMATVRIPSAPIDWEELTCGLSIFLHDIQDPGNLGSIIRSAGWFGIGQIICTPSTVDVYNSKVVQASMGSLLNVNVHYCNPEEFFNTYSRTGLQVYGTCLEGKNIYDCDLDNAGVIIMGNESRGLSDQYSPFVTRKITIPGFESHDHPVESLNVAVAAAIVCSEFRRRAYPPKPISTGNG
ncbi:MAG: RNA methyltransferase [Bacteroidales bacterium]|nr:MAG: RNA methyltransferase [Bacteroidales bacterium]